MADKSSSTLVSDFGLGLQQLIERTLKEKSEELRHRESVIVMREEKLSTYLEQVKARMIVHSKPDSNNIFSFFFRLLRMCMWNSKWGM
jgi:hypothetical protein